MTVLYQFMLLDSFTLVNWQLLKQELRDCALLRSFQEDTFSHVPDRDEDDDLALMVN